MIRRILMAALLAIPMAALAVPAQAGGPASAKTYTCTEREKAYRIPGGAVSLEIVAVGARGNGLSGLHSYGARIDVHIDVAKLPAGTSKLYVEVGCPGTTDRSGYGVGGFNGGGDSYGAYGGGGASDVRLSSRSKTALTVTDTRIVVAGGGGGDSGCYHGTVGQFGGSAGHTEITGPGAGGNGSGNTDFTPWCQAAGTAGAGGNAGLDGTAGGAGGHSDPAITADGGAGSLGQGGSEVFRNAGTPIGGGGGGGFWGGGAGGDGSAAGGGGGAGSSHYNASYVLSTTTPSMTIATGDSSITITPSFS